MAEPCSGQSRLPAREGYAAPIAISCAYGEAGNVIDSLQLHARRADLRTKRCCAFDGTNRIYGNVDRTGRCQCDCAEYDSACRSTTTCSARAAWPAVAERRVWRQPVGERPPTRPTTSTCCRARSRAPTSFPPASPAAIRPPDYAGVGRPRGRQARRRRLRRLLVA